MIWKIIDGLINYEDMHDLMINKLNEVIQDNRKETIFLLEHEDVYTAGTSFDKTEILSNNNHDKINNIKLVYTGRGGKYTYHGKGQRIIYPIINLKKHNLQDLHLYVSLLEKWIINTLKYYKIDAFIMENMRGIWVNHNGNIKKIAAIGIRVKKWVSYHGISVNIDCDLSKYDHIIACGIRDYGITSLKDMGVNTNMQEFDSYLQKSFKEVFF